MKEKLLVSSEPMPMEIQEEISRKKIKECIGKIEIKNSIGTCCFIKLPIFNDNHKMKTLLTSNHIINENYFKDRDSRFLKVEINEKKKEIDLLKKRFKYTNKEYDFTIIEIKESDFIDSFLEIDK